jgi:hypothetical protein
MVLYRASWPSARSGADDPRCQGHRICSDAASEISSDAASEINNNAASEISSKVVSEISSDNAASERSAPTDVHHRR